MIWTISETDNYLKITELIIHLSLFFNNIQYL